MRRSIGAVVVVAVAIAGATAVRAQLLRLPSLMPGRAGTGSFLWFNRAFPDLDVELAGEHHYPDQRLRADVLLYFHNQRFGHCFVAPDGLRVAVNGHPLDRFQPGYEHRRGEAWFPCEAANYKLREGDAIETDRPTTVTLDLGSSHAEMTSTTFPQHRRLVLRSAGTARAGDTVIVDRRPRNEERAGSSPYVRLERSRAEYIELFSSNGVTYASGTWRFALPKLAPGRYKVNASISDAELAIVDGCRGVHHCLAQVPTSAYLSPPELDVVE